MIKRFITKNKCLFPSVVTSEPADLMKSSFNLLHVSSSVLPQTHQFCIAQPKSPGMQAAHWHSRVPIPALSVGCMP